ncbi:MAG: hypothetical protein QW413_03820 [Nitrososphaerota archaeon]
MPLGVLGIIRFDLLMESIALILAFIVALLAFRAYRVTDLRPFLYLGLGFLLMGIGMLSRVISVSYLLWLLSFTNWPPGVYGRMIQSAELTYSGLRVASYAIFAATYGYALTRRLTATMAILPIQVLIYNPFFEAVSALLLAFVVAWTGINYTLCRTTESGLILTGFTLLLVSHVLFIFTPLGFVFYLSAHLIQLLALCSMIIATLRARKP